MRAPPLREQQAERTRRAVLRAARTLFTTRGYADTSVVEVARRAKVSVDTVYASVGRKPELLLAVHDMVLAGGDEPVPAEERELLPRTAPLLEALREAARTDPGCAAVWKQVNDRRAANMLLLARDLRGTGRLRHDLTDQEVADVVWSTNAVEFYSLLAQRDWDGHRVGAFLQDLWIRLLLE